MSRYGRPSHRLHTAHTDCIHMHKCDLQTRVVNKRTSVSETQRKGHRSSNSCKVTIFDRKNGGKTSLYNCVLEYAIIKVKKQSHLLNVRRTRGIYEVMLPAPMMLRTSCVLPKIINSPSLSIIQLCALD